MILSLADFETVPLGAVAIVGAGPAGLALALDLERLGRRSVIFEAGGEDQSIMAELRRARIAGSSHVEMALASDSGLGGTSHWWGGRCVPFDAEDFLPGPSGEGWLIGQGELEPYLEAATRFLDAGKAVYSGAPIWPGLSDISTETLERWSSRPNLEPRIRDWIGTSQAITLVPGAVVHRLVSDARGEKIAGITVSTPGGSHRREIGIGDLVVAGGGVETTRLLLNSKLAGLSDVLGQGYMGHISGKIATIVLDKPADGRRLDFFLDGDTFVRRRFTLSPELRQRQGIANIAFWADNPPFWDAAHRNGVLSLVWLALRLPLVGTKLLSPAIRESHLGPAPRRAWPHFANVLRNPFAALFEGLGILKGRFVTKPRRPGFLLYSPAGRYALHYHAEQFADERSTISAAGERDALGRPRAEIALRFFERDARSVLAAHEELDRALREAGVGRLEHTVPEGERLGVVLDGAHDGLHQLGTTRMGNDPESSIVDADLRVHGFENLFVASSSVFPSSGQANPTLLLVMLAQRLAARLAGGAAP